MQNENDPFLKIETKVTTWDKKNKKVIPKTKTTEIQKTSMATIKEGDSIITTGGNTTTGNRD